MENMDANVVATNETAEADQLPEGLIEETTDESAVSLEEAINETADSEQAAATQPAKTEPETPPAKETKEPGYVKTRIAEALAKERESIRAEVQAEFNQRMAPIMERLLVEDAKELVRSGEFKSLETAKEYLRMKQGLPAPAAEAEAQPQPRNANGQYAPKTNPNDAATQARIDMLRHQADRIKESRGVDVIAVWNSDPEIKRKVIAGEMDFYDVADEIASKPKKSKPPAPVRTPNGAANDQQVDAIMNMSKEQFNRLVKRVQSGEVRIRQA